MDFNTSGGVLQPQPLPLPNDRRFGVVMMQKYNEIKPQINF